MRSTVKDRGLHWSLERLTGGSGRAVAEAGLLAGNSGIVVRVRDAASRGLRRRLNKYWMLYLFLAAPLGLLVLFHYVPLYGIQIAFKDCRIGIGIWGSTWNGFQHFKDFFGTPCFGRIMRNTVIISFQRLAFGFPAASVGQSGRDRYQYR